MDKGLDFGIAPEIHGDAFHRSLFELAKRPDLHSFLEIGSSSGEGSTQALVSGIRTRDDRSDVRMFCMEISRARFEELQNNYADDGFVHCYNVSSIPAAAFPGAAEVERFHQVSERYRFRPKRRARKLTQTLGWLQRDLDYIAESGADGAGIRLIKQDQGIEFFDFVLIDGSEFTGERDLYEVIGAKVIALDDIRSFKCYNAHRILMADINYRLLEKRPHTRNGFSIFERVF